MKPQKRQILDVIVIVNLKYGQLLLLINKINYGECYKFRWINYNFLTSDSQPEHRDSTSSEVQTYQFRFKFSSQ